MEASKQQRAFYRKLYLCHLISQQPLSVVDLQKQTGMPRRTLQDCIAGFSDIGVQCHFIQQEGGRNNAGYYQIDDWGPIDQQWIIKHLAQVEEVLDIS